MQKSKGKLIAICGIDGSGKTTLINNLKEIYKDNNKIIFTREPGGTIQAENIRKILLSEEGRAMTPTQQMNLFFEARRLHLEEKILPALTQDQIVISDRFDACTFVYQNPHHNNIEDLFWQLRQNIVTNNNIQILYIFLNTSATTAITRESQSQEHNHFDSAKITEIQNRIDRYNTFFQKSSAEVITINTDNITPQQVLQQFQEILKHHLV